MSKWFCENNTAIFQTDNSVVLQLFTVNIWFQIKEKYTLLENYNSKIHFCINCIILSHQKSVSPCIPSPSLATPMHCRLCLVFESSAQKEILIKESLTVRQSFFVPTKIVSYELLAAPRSNWRRGRVVGTGYHISNCALARL